MQILTLLCCNFKRPSLTMYKQNRNLSSHRQMVPNWTLIVAVFGRRLSKLVQNVYSLLLRFVNMSCDWLGFPCVAVWVHVYIGPSSHNFHFGQMDYCEAHMNQLEVRSGGGNASSESNMNAQECTESILSVVVVVFLLIAQLHFYSHRTKNDVAD